MTTSHLNNDPTTDNVNWVWEPTLYYECKIGHSNKDPLTFNTATQSGAGDRYWQRVYRDEAAVDMNQDTSTNDATNSVDIIGIDIRNSDNKTLLRLDCNAYNGLVRNVNVSGHIHAVGQGYVTQDAGGGYNSGVQQRDYLQLVEVGRARIINLSGCFLELGGEFDRAVAVRLGGPETARLADRNKIIPNYIGGTDSGQIGVVVGQSANEPNTNTVLAGTWSLTGSGKRETIGISPSMPLSSTDNTVPRFDGTTGRILQTTGIVIDDSNNASGYASITNPVLIGGTGTTSTLTIRSTSGVGTTGANIIFQGGNNGATELARALNSGFWGWGLTDPNTRMHVMETNSGASTNPVTFGNSATATGTAATITFNLSTNRGFQNAVIAATRTNTPGSGGTRIKFYVNNGSTLLEPVHITEGGCLKVLPEAITVAGALSIDKKQHTLANATGSSYAVALAAPTTDQMGMGTKTISCINATHSVTLATTNITGSGGSTITFDTAGDSITLMPIQTGASSYTWLLLNNNGATVT